MAAASLAIHVVLLSWLAASTTRRLALDADVPRTVVQLLRPAAPGRAATNSAPGASPRAGAASIHEPPSPSSSRAPAAPAPSPAASPIPPSASAAQSPGAAGSSASAVAGAGDGEGVRGALRGLLGCEEGSARVSADERARCAERMARAARSAPPGFDPVPPEKRAYYDAVQAAYQASRHPEASLYRDADGVVRTWGHPPGVGCTFKPSFRPGASLSDKIKATGMIAVPIGPLSCGLMLPQGSMTPELGVPDPGVMR